MVVDSFYSSILGNMGLLAFVMFIIVYMFWIIGVVYNGRHDLYAFTFIYTLFGATNIFTEAFPMNVLFAIGVAYYIRQVYQPLVVRTDREIRGYRYIVPSRC